MTTASDGVAVIATHVAQTDRRALSEAWYGTLHLARNATPLRPPARRAGGARVIPSVAPTARGRGTAAPLPISNRVPQHRPPAHRTDAAGLASTERRRPATETARRIERAVATLATRPDVPATHTVDVNGGRVRLLVHTNGRTTRIVALCSRPVRDQVERALAGARFRLAGAGIPVDAP